MLCIHICMCKCIKKILINIATMVDEWFFNYFI